MNEKEKVNQITEGVIWKQLLLFFFPIVFGTFFQQIYNTADTIVVGRFVGKQALAAVGGSASQIANLIVGFFVGLSSGAAVVISQFYGAKDKKDLSKALHTAFAFSLAAGVVLTIVGIFFARPALLLMKTPADVVDDSAIYLQIYFQPDLQYGSFDPACGGRFQKTIVCSDRDMYFKHCVRLVFRCGISHGNCRSGSCDSYFPGGQCADRNRNVIKDQGNLCTENQPDSV